MDSLLRCWPRARARRFVASFAAAVRMQPKKRKGLRPPPQSTRVARSSLLLAVHRAPHGHLVRMAGGSLADDGCSQELAALVESALLDALARPPQHRRRNREAERSYVTLSQPHASSARVRTTPMPRTFAPMTNAAITAAPRHSNPTSEKPPKTRTRPPTEAPIVAPS